MRTKVMPRLLAIVMQTRQAHPQIDALLQGIVCLLEVTQYPRRIRNGM